MNYRELTHNGLWKNNPALVQLLGLCPLLGVSNSSVNALGLGLASAWVLACSNLCVSVLRQHIPDSIRLPSFVLIIAALTTGIELLMQAFTYDLYLILGIFIPLITTNCIILGRAEAFAAKNPPLPAFYDGFIMGIGFAAVLFVLGSLRELLSEGTWLANMQLLFGPIANNWTIQVFQADQHFLLALLPPGAFLLLGFLIAGKNAIDHRISLKQAPQAAQSSQARRVRVTGVVE